MKKALKILGILIIVIVMAISGLLVYIKTMLPDVGPAPELTVDKTPEKIERGRYLAHHVMVCMDCHSKRDWELFSGPPVDGTWGMGGEVFDQSFGFPGKYVSPNITPANLSGWTDGEIFRAITSGVGKDGRPLFSIMPHASYGKMDERDIHAVIAYIRTLNPIENKTEPSKSDFPMNFIIHMIPQKAQFTQMPEKTDKVAYGKYLVNAAACGDCHTKQDKGKVVGAPFAGGFEFPFPDGSKVISANITPHASGIGGWTSEQFVGRFKAYADSSYVPQKVNQGEFQSVMPWKMYAGMEAEDLEAIYAYLNTLVPQDNSIVRFVPANK
jgi:mono/diheme cytochrome c family protein